MTADKADEGAALKAVTYSEPFSLYERNVISFC
jgi:hypothetical protein